MAKIKDFQDLSQFWRFKDHFPFRLVHLQNLLKDRHNFDRSCSLDFEHVSCFLKIESLIKYLIYPINCQNSTYRLPFPSQDHYCLKPSFFNLADLAK